jgi:hypothetical protein
MRLLIVVHSKRPLRFLSHDGPKILGGLMWKDRGDADPASGSQTFLERRQIRTGRQVKSSGHVRMDT